MNRSKFPTIVLTLGVLFFAIVTLSIDRPVEAQTSGSTFQVFFLGGPNEGDSGVAQWTINIRRNPAATQCTIGYQTLDGTATAPSDYVAASGNLNFLPGEFQKLLSVGIVGDTNFETEERFRFSVTGLAGCEGQNAFVDVTILDTDIPPAGVSAISIELAPEGAEGNVLSTPFTFTIDRVGDLSSACSFNFETRDGTAFSPEDYLPASGTFTFTAGQARALIPVTVVGDPFPEADETFFLHVTGASGCVARNRHFAIATINGDDPPPPLGCNYWLEGDTSPDFAIRVNDLVLLRNAALGIESPLLYGCGFQVADMNGDCGDGRLDAADVTSLRQLVLNGGGTARQRCGPMGPPIPL